MKILTMNVNLKDGKVTTKVGMEEISPGHPSFPLAELTREVAEANPGQIAVGTEATENGKQTYFDADTLDNLGRPPDQRD